MIKKSLKALVAHPLSMSLLTMTRRDTVCAVTYHRINAGPSIFPGLDVDTFRQQMVWLKRHCRLLRADEFSNSLHSHRERRPRVLVTFDDGYRNFHDTAVPILRELDIPCLVFLPTAFIGTGKLIWTDMIDAAVQRTQRDCVALPIHSGERAVLGGLQDRSRLALRVKQHLKSLDDDKRRAAVDRILDELGVPQPQELVPRQMMIWDEVRATMPLATVGGHSHEHPILARLSDADLGRDLERSQEIFGRELGSVPRHFAYPNGTPGDFDARTVARLKHLGYQLAFTTIPGLNGPRSDCFALRRQSPACATSDDFAWQVLGASGILRRQAP